MERDLTPSQSSNKVSRLISPDLVKLDISTMWVPRSFDLYSACENEVYK